MISGENHTEAMNGNKMFPIATTIQKVPQQTSPETF